MLGTLREDGDHGGRKHDGVEVVVILKVRWSVAIMVTSAWKVDGVDAINDKGVSMVLWIDA